MRIAIEAGTALLTPTSKEEREVLAKWRGLEKGARLKYEGRGPDESPGFWTVKLSAAGVTLLVRGDAKDDQLEVNGLRNVCYFGKGGGLLYLGHRAEVMVVAGAHCKLCKEPVSDMPSCEWEVCQACSERCAHAQTEDGFTHSETVEISHKRFCTACGRVPAESVK